MSVYLQIIRTSARQQWTYRAELVMRCLSMVLFMGVFMALWTTAYGVSGRSDIAGYSMLSMVWYLAMTETIVLSSSRAFVEISEEVKSGHVAYKLLRPLSYPTYQLSNSLGDTLPRFAINLLTAVLVVLLVMGQTAGSLAGLGAFVVTATLALILDALIAVGIGLLAFWIEEVTPIYWIYQKLVFTIGGMFLPLEMFPDWLRSIVQWLPFSFITYVPARAFVSFEISIVLWGIAGQLVYIAVIGTVVWSIWRRARTRLTVHGG